MGQCETVLRQSDGLCVLSVVFGAAPESTPFHRGEVCRDCQEPPYMESWKGDAIGVRQRYLIAWASSACVRVSVYADHGQSTCIRWTNMRHHDMLLQVGA